MKQSVKIDTAREIVEDWEKKFYKGVIYYLRDKCVRGGTAVEHLGLGACGQGIDHLPARGAARRADRVPPGARMSLPIEVHVPWATRGRINLDQ